MAMVKKYVKFVIQDIGLPSGPIWPFDPSTGTGNNIGYHYAPDVVVHELHNLGYAIMHYQDNDSRRVCCVECDEAVLVGKPNLLTDVVVEGFAPFGGAELTPQEALTLVQYLEPARQFQVPDPQNPGQTITVTYGAVSLDANDYLTRTITRG
jgi:hypothetical protein